MTKNRKRTYTRLRRRKLGTATSLALGGALFGVAPAVLAVGATTTTAAPAAAATAQPLGIDIANYQHPNGAAINWGQVKGAGIEYAFVKATEGPVGCTGNHYTNGYFKKDFADVKNNGMYRGAYHFARPGNTDAALTQARYFANAVGPINTALDLPPVLDLEVTCGADSATLINFTRVWLDEVTRLTGRKPIIYTGYYFWKDHMANTNQFAGYPLWIATYGSKPMVPPVWSQWTFWQYTSTGSVPGISGNVDMNRFAFGSDGLARLAGDQPIGPSPDDPDGVFDTATGGKGTINVTGWAYDSNTPTQPINVHVYVDGVPRTALLANGYRPDVGAALPKLGNYHGYSGRIGGMAGGTHSVCVYGINVGTGRNRDFGCKNVTVTEASPLGTVDATTAAFGAVRTRGWALDPDSTSSIPVHVYIDGRFAASSTANASRPDVGSALGVSPSHGFDITVPNVVPGPHQVCTYALNIAGEGSNRLLGCTNVDLLGGSPKGTIDSATAVPGGIKLKGWALDPDTPNAVQLHAYVNGVPRVVTANTSYPTIGQLYPAWGPNHGFDFTVAGLSTGRQNVCLYAINVASGGNTTLGCQDIDVLGGAPISSLDVAQNVPGGLRIGGWAFDPDTTAPVPVHVYVDGVGREVMANKAADLGRYQGTYGANHGFDLTWTGLTPGDKNVCVYAINTSGTGGNNLIGCRTIRVSAGAPIGALNTVTPGAGEARIQGWAIDPDTAEPVPVHLYVDGVGYARTANVNVPVLGYFFPAYGANHGFDTTITGLRRGQHTVCAYGINVKGGGANALLGCQTFTTP